MGKSPIPKERKAFLAVWVMLTCLIIGTQFAEPMKLGFFTLSGGVIDAKKVLFGILLTSLLADPFMGFLLDALREYGRRRFGAKCPNIGFLSMTVGFVERVLYVASLLVGRPEFIVIWLGAKTAIHWKGWEKNERHLYTIFLVGTGLNVLFALFAAMVASGMLVNNKHSPAGIRYHPISFLLANTILSGALLAYWRWRWNKSTDPKESQKDLPSEKDELPEGT